MTLRSLVQMLGLATVFGLTSLAMPDIVQAGGVRLSIGIGVPVPIYPAPVVVYPAPVVVYRAPVVVSPPPAVVYPGPVVVRRPPVVVGGRHGGGDGYRGGYRHYHPRHQAWRSSRRW